jgi:hypothetical protein
MDVAVDTEATAAHAESSVHRLDDLLSLDHAALDALYRGGRAPALERLRGDLRGRMLAAPILPGPVAAIARAWASSSFFPWRGKSFRALDAGHGEGINRVVLDRLRLFRFETTVGPGHDVEGDVVRLDYDHPGNPWVIRIVEDEVRTIAPGVLLGQAWVRLHGRAHFGLWFGLEEAS